MARRRWDRPRGEDGLAAEYAVTMVAACGFAGLLLKLLTSNQVWQLLLKAVLKAFSQAF